jgi:hypothetical protein
MDNIIACGSCGAKLNIQKSFERFFNCEFCGALVINNTFQDTNFDLVRSDIVGDSSISRPNKIIYIERGIKNVNQVISLYSDPEIDTIRRVILKKNNLTSLSKISRFMLSYLDVSNNDIYLIDDFPRIEERYYNFEYKTSRWGITLDFRNNVNLTGFDSRVMDIINGLSNVKSFILILSGCISYKYDTLSLIKFINIIDEDGGKARIFVDENTCLDPELSKLGFKEKKEETRIDDYEVSKTYTIWEYHRIIPQKIKIGGQYSSTELDKTKVDIVYNTLKNSNEHQALETAKKVFKINDYAAKDLIEKIRKTEYYFRTTNKETSNSCFVATATMGDYDHPAVMDLRLFRDNWLLKRQWGIDFTNWYYTHGPKAASMIEKSTFMRKLTYICIIKPLQIITKKIR